jgi:hypothetical protein
VTSTVYERWSYWFVLFNRWAGASATASAHAVAVPASPSHTSSVCDVSPAVLNSARNETAKLVQQTLAADARSLRPRVTNARRRTAHIKPMTPTQPKAFHCHACGSSRQDVRRSLHESSHFSPNPQTKPTSPKKPLISATPSASTIDARRRDTRTSSAGQAPALTSCRRTLRRRLCVRRPRWADLRRASRAAAAPARGSSRRGGYRARPASSRKSSARPRRERRP